jgi:hypothetical protein
MRSPPTVPPHTPDIAFVLMEHRYNHPCIMVFNELMLLHLRRIRILNKVVMHRRRAAGLMIGGEKASGLPSKRTPNAGETIKGTALVSPARAHWHWAAAAALQSLSVRRCRARTRWRLALVLLWNPTLRKHRWHCKYDETNPELIHTKEALSSEREVVVAIRTDAKAAPGNDAIAPRSSMAMRTGRISMSVRPSIAGRQDRGAMDTDLHSDSV